MADNDEELWLPTDDELELMSDEQLDEYLRLVAVVRRAEEERWTAQPKQALATELALRAVETLFGGAAGGGKSEWLLHHALDQMLQHENNRGVIFRRVFPSLERTLIARARQFYGNHGAVWNGQKHTWTFSNGSILEFASLQYEDTVLEHQGAEYGFVGFEEITEFTESQVDYMIGRLRAPAPGIRPHMAATANPGGRGHRWVKRRWVKPKDTDYVGEKMPRPFEVWRPAPTVENPEPNPRVFVPATLADNPLLLARDPSYRSRLRALAGTNKALLKAMEHGDWDAIDAIEGALWNQSDLDAGRVAADYVRRIGALERVVAVDPSDGNEDGKGDSYGVSVCARGLDGAGYVEYVSGWRANPLQMAKNTVALYHSTGADAIVVERNHGGKWVKTVLHQVDPYVNVVEVWASDGKMTRARPVAALFEPVDGLDLTSRYRGRLAGRFEEFEEQATTYTGQPGEASPNELDAVVWGLTYLLLKGRQMHEGGQYGDERLRGRR